MATVLPLFSGTASGTGSSFEVLTGRRMAFALFASGSIGTASIEGSFDGSVWFSLVGSVGNYSESTALVRFVRAIYDDLGRTGTATVQALQSDEDE